MQVEFDTDVVDPEERARLAARRAADLLVQTNRLLRWYRTVTREGSIIELTRAQASPVSFTVVGENAEPDTPFVADLVFEAPVVPIAVEHNVVSARVREGLVAETDPPVGELFMLDAEQAMRSGRFREGVLFCWSTIDATFGVKYEQLVAARLDGEWRDGRDFLIDFNSVPMKSRMTSILFLLTGRSLFREPDLWEDLVRSYQKRNRIIHAGETASEDEAALALRVARRVVEFVGHLP